MIPPEAPAGGAVRQAVLDDQPDGGVDDPAGVVAAGVGQVGHVGHVDVEVLAAAGAVVPGVGHDDVVRPTGAGVAEVVEGAAAAAIAVGAVAAPRARPAPVVAAPAGDDGLGQVLDAGDAFGGVGSVLAGSGHGDPPEGKVLPGNTFDCGRAVTDPARFPRYRLALSRIIKQSGRVLVTTRR